MRNRTWIGIAASVVAGVCFVGASTLVADDKKPAAAGQGGQPDEAAMMEMWQKSIAPGEHHKTLEMMAGKFKAVTRYKMDPAQEWQTSEGTYEGRMIMGGRYLESTNGGEMMGMPFEGRGYMAYDNLIKKHIAVWMDNFGTGVLCAQGDCDSTGRQITFHGEMPDPMAGGAMTKYKFTYDIKSADEFVFHWFMPNPAGGEMWESMTITYTRVK